MPRRPVTLNQVLALKEYRQRERMKANQNRVGHRTHHALYEAKEKDYLSRFAEIPPDTRSLTGILFGDPLPNDPRRQTNGIHPRLV